jgi:hypothetical protein
MVKGKYSLAIALNGDKELYLASQVKREKVHNFFLVKFKSICFAETVYKFELQVHWKAILQRYWRHKCHVVSIYSVSSLFVDQGELSAVF